MKIPSKKKYDLGFPNPVEIHKQRDKGRGVKLTDFIGNGSKFIFDELGFKTDWLSKPSSEWSEDKDFLEMKNFISNILVCNDAAERGIKLVSEYADVLTMSSKGRKELLQVVEKHRKEYPDVNKSTQVVVAHTSMHF